MTFGIESYDWQQLSALVIDPLKTSGASVWIFGSRARGDHQPFSDVDLLYEYPQGGINGGLVPSEVKEQIENSNFPYKVDLVQVSDVAESYRSGVLADRLAL